MFRNHFLQSLNGMLCLTWYDDDVWLVADALVAVQLRDHHDPVLSHGHDPSDDDDSDDDHWVVRSCLGHSLTPCCPLAVASPRPVRLATLGLSAVHSLLSTAQHYTLLYTRSHRTVSFFWQQFKRLLFYLKERPLNNRIQITRVNMFSYTFGVLKMILVRGSAECLISWMNLSPK